MLKKASKKEEVTKKPVVASKETKEVQKKPVKASAKKTAELPKPKKPVSVNALRKSMDEHAKQLQAKRHQRIEQAAAQADAALNVASLADEALGTVKEAETYEDETNSVVITEANTVLHPPLLPRAPQPKAVKGSGDPGKLNWDTVSAGLAQRPVVTPFVPIKQRIDFSAFLKKS